MLYGVTFLRISVAPTSGVAAPLVIALRDQRHLVAAPQGQGEAAAVVAPRRRIEAAQAGVAAALDETRLVAAVRVRQARGEADAADFALGVAVDRIGAGQASGRRRLRRIDRRRLRDADRRRRQRQAHDPGLGVALEPVALAGGGGLRREGVVAVGAELEGGLAGRAE